jgi:hypothetical protein
MQEVMMGWACRMGGVRHSYRILMGKPHRKRQYGRLRRGKEENI